MKRFIIEEGERERILNMHKTAVLKEPIFEQLFKKNQSTPITEPTTTTTTTVPLKQTKEGTEAYDKFEEIIKNFNNLIGEFKTFNVYNSEQGAIKKDLKDLTYEGYIQSEPNISSWMSKIKTVEGIDANISDNRTMNSILAILIQTAEYSLEDQRKVCQNQVVNQGYRIGIGQLMNSTRTKTIGRLDYTQPADDGKPYLAFDDTTLYNPGLLSALEKVFRESFKEIERIICLVPEKDFSMLPNQNKDQMG